LLSAIIPQKDIASGQITDVKENLGKYYVVIEKLKLDEIYTAPYFFIVLGLLATNIILGNIKRFRTIYKTEKTLIKARHLGSILFHFSLILIMIGVILNYLYKFEGIYGITEGQTVADEENNYFGIINGPFYVDDYDRFKLKLNEVDVKYQIEENTTTAAYLTLYQPYSKIEKKVVLAINKQYSFNDFEFHYGLTAGYSPHLIVTDSTGVNVFRSFVRVAHHKKDGKSKHYDFVILEQLNLKIEIEVLPDSGSIDSTLFKIKVANETDILYDGTMSLNQEIAFDNYSLVIPEIRRWCYINVIKSPYLSLVFWGFWLAILGMTIGFIPRVYSDIRGIR
jgi:hypothetical protein